MKNNLNTIRIRGKCLLLLMTFQCLFSYVTFAQKSKISGTVIGEEDGQPIPGVAVMVKGSTTGTITDIDGNYNIKAKLNEILIFSFIGLQSEELKITASVHNVSLSQESIDIDEIVAIGYGTQKKKEVTGAVAQVKAESIANVVSSDLGTALQGRVSGVNITSGSGAPGETSEILIRGISSVAGANTPLYVVDGVPQEGDPQISSNEIETIDILKDAASCAIYGTRGAAGVILITTKRGEEGAMKVSANASYGIQQMTNDIELMNSVEQTYFDLIYERNRTGLWDSDILLKLEKQQTNIQNDTDLWETVFVDNAAIQDYNVNLSGGSKNLSYNLTTGYYEEEGIEINSNFQRFNTRLNTAYTQDKLRVTTNFSISQEDLAKAASNMITQSIKYQPTQPAIDLDSDEAIESDGGGELTRLNNALQALTKEDVRERTKVQANFGLNYEILEGLKFNTTVGMSWQFDHGYKFAPHREVVDSEGNLLSDPMKSYIEKSTGKKTSISADFGLSYLKKFGAHKVSALAVGTLEKYTFDNFQAIKYNVTNNDIRDLDNAVYGPDATSSGLNYVNKIAGMLGRVQYDYKGKYLMSASVRRDGSSKFAEENRWGIFPSTSIGWNVSDEEFWSPIKSVANSFKIRASYGTVGNQNFAAYSYENYVATGYDYAYGPNATPAYGTIQTDFGNHDIKWETSIQSNIGFDLAFFENKFIVNAEYYQTDKEDMLFDISLPGSSGGGSNSKMTMNVGNMTNYGYEISATYRGKLNKLKYSVGGTFSTNENEITSMNGVDGIVATGDSGLISGAKTQSLCTFLAEGYEAGAFFLYTTDGIIKTEEQLQEYKKLNSLAKMGDLIYKDNNEDGKISEEDRVYCGSGLPEYEIGINLNLAYKGFDFAMQWYGAMGQEIMNGSKATAYGYGRHKDLLYQYSDVNTDTTIPAYRGDTKAHANFRGDTDLWLEDGSYWRLKNVTLGYSFPQATLKKVNISKLRLYVTAQNPITITDYEGFDPEIGGGIKSRGLDKGNYPVTASYIFGVNLSF